MSDLLKRGVAHDSAVRFLSVRADEAVAIATQRHNLDRKGTEIIGEAMIAALMMSAYIKGNERITMQIQCEKPRLSLICDVNAEGHIRARLSPTRVRGDHTTLAGVMLVIKHNASEELYRGVTEIQQEGIPTALQRHLQNSSQVDTVLKFDVTPGGRAAGLLVERLPAASGLTSLTPDAFNATYGDLAAADGERLFAEVERDTLMGYDLLSAEARPITWRCQCSQARVEGMLTALGAEQLHEMLEEDGGAEITCHFCNLQYTVSGPRLAEIIESLGVNA